LRENGQSRFSSAVIETSPVKSESEVEGATGSVRAWIIGTLAFLVTLAALVPGALFRGETFAFRDLGNFQRPLASLLVRLSSEGSWFPGWNPYSASGQPFAANPNAIAHHPVAILFHLLPFEIAFLLQVLLPLGASSISMAFLLRTIGRSAWASVYGALAWGLGGYLLSTTNLLAILLAVAPLPAVLALAVRTVRDNRRRDAAWLAIAFGLECLAGEPSILMATIPLIAAAAAEGLRGRNTEPITAASEASPPKLGRNRPLLRLGLALVLGLAVGGATLLPEWALSRKTERFAEGGLSPAEASTWSLPPLRICELITPRLLGHVERDQIEPGWYWGGPLYPGRECPFILSIYAGLLTALLAALAVRQRVKRSWLWMSIAAGGFAVSIGNHAPLWNTFRRLSPLFSSLRYTERFVVIIALPVVVLAASGLDLLLVDAHGSRGLVRRWSKVLAAGGAGVAASTFLIPESFWIQWGISPGIAGRFGPQLRFDAAWFALLALGGFFAARRTNRRLLAVSILTVGVLDLAVAGRPLIPTVPVDRVATPPPTLQRLIDAKLDGPVFHHAVYDPRHVYVQQLTAPPVPSVWGIATTLEHDADRTQLVWTRQGTRLFFEAIEQDPSLAGPLLARRGVAAIIRVRPRASSNPEHIAGGSPEKLEIVGIKEHRPFEFFVERIERVSSDRDWLEAVKRLGPASARAAVIDQTLGGAFPEKPSTGHVDGISRLAERIDSDVTVDGPQPGLLAINQSWDTGWLATIDKIPTPVLRTDIGLSAIVTPPGRHRVELRYSDPWAARGGILSLAALGLSLMIALQERFGIPRRRRSAPGSIVAPGG